MRTCPNCNKDELEELGLTKWQCENCKKIYDESFLDADVEFDE